MDEKAMFLKYWQSEAPATRKVLSRIPQDRSDYRPDPKARTARELAWVIVQEQILLVEGMEKGVIEWADAPTPATVTEILDRYDRHHESLTEKLQGIDASRWQQSIALTYQGQEVMNDTLFGMGWGFLLDLIHHRGQLSTYLRPMGATVPQIYGPSADEPM
jgi:uncharacterized damage-inducible protein DinB